MSAQAILERIVDTDQNSSAEVVNKFSIIERLDRLAPEHRAAAVRRAMRSAGVQADLPDPDTLAIAENPPEVEWRPIHHAEPTADTIRQAAVVMLDTVAWRSTEILMRPRSEQLADATRSASLEAWQTWGALPKYEIANPEEYQRGQDLTKKWGPVLDALRTMLDDAEERIPGLYLAAVPEPDLRKMAAMRAFVGRCMTGGETLEPEDEEELTPAQRRVRCEKYHIKVLRDTAKKARQAASALFGTVGRGGSDYADSYSLARWQERQKAAQKWAQDKFLLIRAEGKVIKVPLAEVMRSAEKAGLSQLYAMHLGIDEHAETEDLAAIFITITLPPEYHPNPSMGSMGWNPDFLPEHADRELNHLWRKFRARMAKKGIRPFGLRVIEPHKDGCPHLHALLYVQPNEVQSVDNILLAMRPESVPGQRRATKLEVIDRRRGAPTTYVMKYLIKSRNDSSAAEGASGHDSGDGDHLASHDRVRAWASERGIRRFGWVGAHGFNRIWRAIHVRKEMPATAPRPFQEAHAALHTRRYRDALAAMGALRDGRPRMRLEYEETESRYGETVKRAVAVRIEGHDDETQMLALRKYEATIVDKDDNGDDDYVTWCRRLREEELAEREARVTVIVSFPSSLPLDSCEGEAGGRTGPPTPSEPYLGVSG